MFKFKIMIYTKFLTYYYYLSLTLRFKQSLKNEQDLDKKEIDLKVMT